MKKHKYNHNGYRYIYNADGTAREKIHKCSECKLIKKQECGKLYCPIPRCIYDKVEVKL